MDTYTNNKNFFKPNYYEALQYLVPKFLLNEDQENFGKEVDLKDQIINAHINLAANFTSVLPISALPGTVFSSINTLSGIAPFFIKQNGLTNITPEFFQVKILNVVDRNLQDFATKQEFGEYVSGTLLPAIRLNAPASYFENSTESLFGGGSFQSSAAHTYLIQNLSWLYFLNTTGTSYNPHTDVSRLITDNIYMGRSIQLNDCLKILMEFIWRNNFTSYIPNTFVSAAGTYTSGTQQLDKLKTWIDVIYSPLYADRNDLLVRDRFDLYIQNGLKISEEIPDGPFFKLLRMLSFAAYDTDSDIEQLDALNNIEECPNEYLPFLAELIGWKLYGSDPSRWRLQLRNAVDIYKKTGTKKAIQLAMNTIFPKDAFDLESRITEVWESYIPFLIYYALATESEYFKSNYSWTRETALKMNVNGYSFTSIDENIKLATDRIIHELHDIFPSNFKIPNKENKFFYRGAEQELPPFEEYPYYAGTELTNSMIEMIVDRLVCFGVRRKFADQVGDYIRTNTQVYDDEPIVGWLFYTSGYNSPPNLNDLMLNLNSEKFEYASLWSGKSSHFKLDFNSNEFNFIKKTVNVDSGGGFALASEIITDLAPTHAIPMINLRLSGEGDPMGLAADMLPIAYNNDVDLNENARPVQNYEVSAFYVSGYKRNTGQGKVYGRQDVNYLQSDLLKTAISLSSVPRNSLRRRSYEKIMPMYGYYDRTGFNMPVSYQVTRENTKLPLGLIPSSLTYTPVSDYIDLPPIWTQCENLNSRNSYYNYYVSNTMATRAGDYGSQKNLVILAGQSNMNGRGSAARTKIDGIYYWDLNSSSFNPTVIPKANTSVEPNLLTGAAPNYGTLYWGPELKFIDRLKQNKLFNTYIFKFAADNSTVVDRKGQGTWCPSATGNAAIYPKFEKALDAAISALGGFTEINNISLIWSQGESEAGLGQNGNASALQFSAASKYFFDTVRAKFPSELDFNIIRTKLNVNYASGSQPDWAYYPSGQAKVEGACIPFYGSIVSAVSSPGYYGFWSWSSTNIVRAQQEALDKNVYGPLVSLDDLSARTFDDVFSGTDVRAPSSLGLNIPGCISAFYYNPVLYHYNIHYVDDTIDIIGNRLYDAWASSTKLGSISYIRDFRNDRGQLPKIYNVMHTISEKKKYYQASSLTSPSLWEFTWKNPYESYANSATEVSGWFPNSVEDYYNYKFGRDLHKLYQTYTKEFNRHAMSEYMTLQDGPNIFSHVYGPIFYNHDFSDIANSNYLVTSVSSTAKVSNSNASSISGAVIASSTSSLYYTPYQPEIINSGVLPGVDLINVSATSPFNAFYPIKLPISLKPEVSFDYIYERTFLKVSNLDGLSRIRFDIRKPITDSNYPNSQNFLLPEHKYKVSINSLVTSNDALRLGGRTLAIWVHTKPEQGKVWSYSKKNIWEQHEQAPDRDFLEENFFFKFTFPESEREFDPSSTYQKIKNLKCIDIVKTFGLDFHNALLTIDKSDFITYSLEFDTINKNLMVDRAYGSSYGQVHRKDQNYVVEFILLPDTLNGLDTYLLIDDVSMVDLTLNKMSQIIALDGVCPEIRIPLEKHELETVFKYWNDISGKNYKIGFASRDVSETSGVMFSQGGSRLDYRLSSDWVPSFSGITKYISSSKMIDTIMVPVC